MFEVDGICVQVQRAPIRNLYLTVQAPDAHVNVKAPHWVDTDKIVAFVQAKRRWIDAKRAIMQQNPFCKQKLYAHGETHLMFGKPYQLQLKHSDNHRGTVRRVDKRLVLCVDDASQLDCATLLSQYQRQELTALLDDFFSIWCNVMQLTLHGFAIRRLKRLWGSCNIPKKYITINLVMVHYPLSCIEYVVVHELVHLFEPTHNRRFYQLLEQYMPRWREQHNFLRRYTIGTYS